MNIQILRDILKFEPNDIFIYQNAFIHKSALKNTTDFEHSNERLEFLGDSVLSIVVAEVLYKKYPNEQEGFLTKQRTKLVNGKTLSKLAKSFHFDRFILMDERGMMNEWNTNTKILENTFEAFIGSLYLDQGFDVAKIWISNVIQKEIEDDAFLENTNYKEQVIKYFPDSKFKISNELGKDNNKTFVVHLLIQEKLLAEGYGMSKKDAEQDASKKCLHAFCLLQKNIV